jgi:hypothetical protein
MARATLDRNDDAAGATSVATTVTFDDAGCTGPVRWTSTATEVWRCPCCDAWIAPNQTHRCLIARRASEKPL